MDYLWHAWDAITLSLQIIHHNETIRIYLWLSLTSILPFSPLPVSVSPLPLWPLILISLLVLPSFPCRNSIKNCKTANSKYLSCSLRVYFVFSEIFVCY